MSGVKCVECGRFLGTTDFVSGRCDYEPESEFGHERIEWSCRKCCEKQKPQSEAA